MHGPVEVNETSGETPDAVHPSIFKAYDIRGVYPDELDGSAARAIGNALSRHLDAGPVVVGRDMRQSGVELLEQLVGGLRAQGRDVLDIGRVATPVVYYATCALRAAGGVMITASHNPGRYNGFKLCRERAVPIGIDSGLRQIREDALGPRAALGERTGGDAAGGSLRAVRVLDDYHRSLLEAFPGASPATPRRVAIDAGNGIAGEAISGLLAQLPLEVTRLYFEPDGSFPNHEADPLKPENVADLRRAVLRSGAELGVAFDGDGDRAVFVDEQGDALPADLTTALFTRMLFDAEMLGAEPGAPVVYDLRSSRVVAEEVLGVGGVPVRSRVGHAFMKHAMREQGACFGGELSGHYYFRFPTGYVADDGAAALMLMLCVLGRADLPLSALWQPLRRYAQSGEVNRTVDDVPGVLERIRAAHPEGKADQLDGLTIEYADWWFNVRPSNTEPLLRLNVEAPTREEMISRRDTLLRLIEA